MKLLQCKKSYTTRRGWEEVKWRERLRWKCVKSRRYSWCISAHQSGHRTRSQIEQAGVIDARQIQELVCVREWTFSEIFYFSVYYLHSLLSIVQKCGFADDFERSLLCSSRLHLFDHIWIYIWKYILKSNVNFQHHYSSLQCHMILQKSF